MKKKVIGFPIYEGVDLLDFTGASEVFSFSGLFDVLWLSSSDAPVVTASGFSVLPNANYQDCEYLDILYIPGGSADGVVGAMNDPILINFIQKISPKCQWVGSVCVGAFILAASGELHDCEVTTYWSQISNLKILEKPFNLKVAEGFPRYIIDVKNRRFTGGGISSTIDLSLRLVELLYGIESAETTQLSIQYEPNPPTDSGDPDNAPFKITEKVFKAQLEGFIEPITKAVLKLSESIN